MIQIGYYGKTIHRGDFVRFNLPQALIAVIDDWLQLLLTQGEDLHKDNWPAIYADCPVYRFYLSTDIAGSNAWVGAMVAGTDKVGRRFPFVAAAALPDDKFLPWNHLAVIQCQAQLDRLVRESSDPASTFDTLQTSLEQVAEEFSEAVRDEVVTVYRDEGFSNDANSLEQPLVITAPYSSSVQNGANTSLLLDCVLKQTLFCYSLWSAAPACPSDLAYTTLCTGLPVDKAGMALFDQNWTKVSMLRISGLFSEAGTYLPDTPSISEHNIDAGMDSTVENAKDLDHTLGLESADIETVATSKEWLALEQSETPAIANDETITPDVETLDLDEDVTNAPWDDK